MIVDFFLACCQLVIKLLHAQVKTIHVVKIFHTKKNLNNFEYITLMRSVFSRNSDTKPK